MFPRRSISEDDIAGILTQEYGLSDVSDVSSLPGGTFRCFRARAAEGEFVAKQLPAKYYTGPAQSEPALAEVLRARGVPTARFLLTRDGRHAAKRRRQVLLVQQFVPGRSMPLNSLAPQQLGESAAMLARIQRALREVPPLPERYGRRWFTQWRPPRLEDYYAHLLAAAGKLPDGHVLERIRGDLQYKLQALSAVASIEFRPEELTCCNSHGDYHVGQLIFGPEGIRGVLDFANASTVPAAWELIRSYAYASPACARGQIDAEGLAAYVRHYLAGLPLSPYDLEAMPHVFYAYLVRSRLGYKEYLARPAGGTDALLELAFWRTDLARWLEGHADALGRSLAELAR